jgi:hypothetical protein
LTCRGIREEAENLEDSFSLWTKPADEILQKLAFAGIKNAKNHQVVNDFFYN